MRRVAFWSGGRLFKSDLGGEAPQLLAEVPQPSGMTWTSTGQIVIAIDRRLAVVPEAGGPARPLTTLDTANGEVLQQGPVALPGGKQLLYSSWNGTGLEGVRIGIVSLADGRTRLLDVRGTMALGVVAGRLLGSAGMARAALSASGTFAYVSGTRESVLAIADGSGQVTPILPEARMYGYPRYSPDGKKIAYTQLTGSRADVWVYDFASRTPIRLTTGATVNERPEWTPDGKRIVYRSDQSSQRSIWWVPADLSGPAEPLIATARDAVFEAVVTPDGRHLVYQEDTTGADLWYRALSPDSAAHPVATSRFLENMARVSPDGHWVAFTTDESGNYQVVVQPFPGPGPRVQVSTRGGTEPVWSPDGTRLFYRGEQKMLVATVATAPGFRVTGRSVFGDDSFMLATSPHANYDVAADGKHLLVLKGQLDPRLYVVHNWVRELLERTGRAGR